MDLKFKIKVLKQRYSRKPTRVVFIHVPKCGGSSVEAAIGNYHLLDNFPNISDKGLRIARQLNRHLDTENQDPTGSKEIHAIFCYCLAIKKSFIGGHFRISKELIPYIKRDYKLITLLRDPVDRFISNYVYSRIRLAQEGVRPPKMNIAEELNAYLAADNINVMANRFCCYLGAEPLVRQGNFPDAAELATSNLMEFDAVGFLDNISAFEEKLRDLLDLPSLKIGHERKTEKFIEPGGRAANDYKALFQDKEIMKTVEYLCSADRRFYQTALEVLAPV